MKEQRFYFYRPNIDGHFLDNGISAIELIRTVPGLVFRLDIEILKVLWKLRSSHAEAEDHDKEIMYTSTMRMDESSDNQKANGLIKRPSAGVLKNPKRWYYYKISVNDDVHQITFDLLDDLVSKNQGYDKRYIAKFLTGPRGRKLIEKLSGKPFNDPLKYICSGFTFLAANTSVGEEFHRHQNLIRVLLQLERLARKFNGDEPDPLSLSIAFYRAGLIPYSQVDHKPLIRG